MDLYREEMLEHWQNPLNFGVIPDADIIIEQVNPLCGDQVTFYFKLSSPMSSSRLACRQAGKRGSRFSIKSGSKTRLVESRMTDGDLRRITHVSFTGSGCAISTASASMLSEEIKGKSVKDLSKITGADVLKLIGGTVAPARLKCVFLPLEVIRKLII